MNWDWEKLQERRQRQPGGGSSGPGGGGPNFDHLSDGFKKLRDFKFPAGKFIILIAVVIWLLSGIYIVDPAEEGIVLRFGQFSRKTEPGPHYHLPYPIERAITVDIKQYRRLEIGFRSLGRESQFQQGEFRLVPEEALMLTGDENIVDVQFIVQYRIKDSLDYLFKVDNQQATVKSAAEAAMREVIGHNKIDSALTIGKLEIQNQTRDLLQEILDIYEAGILVVAVQLQDVHPPKEVVDAFKDVASAREDKSRFINEAQAYKNDILPKARGLAAQYVNQAKAYKESSVRKAKGEASRFLALLTEYNKAKDVTRERLYIETMETILSNPDLEKVIMSDKSLSNTVPYLPLDRLFDRNSSSSGAKQSSGQTITQGQGKE